MINDFDQGFLSALASFGIGKKQEAVNLPDMSKLVFINCAYHTGDIGEGTCYLSQTTYRTVFSSKFSYIPKKGGIVLMGSYQLVDWEYFGDIVPRAMMRITADSKVIFEGEVAEFFPETTVKKVRGFAYEKDFAIEAKRLNLTDNMALELYQTMIIGYK